MTTATVSCPGCGAQATGRFCSNCGTALTAATCRHCRADLTPQARFCHRCGQPAAAGGAAPFRASDRSAWIFAGALCLTFVGAIVYRVAADNPAPAAPDMANAGSSVPGRAGEPGVSAGPAPDISRMTPRERFDRLFNRIMESVEQGDSAQVLRFTPMALGAYSQLDTTDVDARYHAAVLRMQTGDLAGAAALADTIAVEQPGHLFAYVIRGSTARLRSDTQVRARAQREFLQHHDAELAAKRVEYLEHRPVIEEFKREAEAASAAPASTR
ncbi:MAG: zinc ribbon domain-containing protein [Gemmatimonadales bacterium]|nr:zinc ribbon domain-containing protein [Gemmatimonadales bacterium]MDQ3426340.1 zinc ribbon domain-containing protein [Gemmatimonadota bacterium]